MPTMKAQLPSGARPHLGAARARSWTAALAAALLWAGSAQLAAGCNGCSPKPEAPPPAPAPEPAPAAAPTPNPEAPPETEGAAPTEGAAVDTPEFEGPSARNAAGYQLATGFVDAEGKPLTQPEALAPFRVYATLLDAETRPIGALASIAGAEIHGFLVARDVRQAYYAKGTGPIATGADGRALGFEAREGGEHALVTLVQPSGGTPQVIATPIVLRGNLPQVAGPGAANLPSRAPHADGDIILEVSPAHPQAEAEVRLSLRTSKPGAPATGNLAVTWLIACAASFASCELVQGDGSGTLRWVPRTPGVRLLLLPDATGKRALTFGLAVMPAAEAAAGAAGAAAAPAAPGAAPTAAPTPVAAPTPAPGAAPAPAAAPTAPAPGTPK